MDLDKQITQALATLERYERINPRSKAAKAAHAEYKRLCEMRRAMVAR